MVEAADPDLIRSKRKAISTLFPYAVHREQEGRHEMFDVILHLAKVSTQSGFMWHRIGPLATALLDEESPVSSKRAMVLALPHVPWRTLTNSGHLIQLWAVAASAVPYTDDIGRSVVETLLEIASLDSTSPHIPVGMWSWLNKGSFLHLARHQRTHPVVVRTIRARGDIGVLKPYLLRVWSERDDLQPGGFEEMRTSIWENFIGATMEEHRKDLLQHLDHILEELDLGLEHLRSREPNLNESTLYCRKYEYGRLKETLLWVDRQGRDHTNS